jgi:hypothetical protein
VGHIRLRRLPRTLKWDRVVSLLVAGQPAEEIAASSAEAAEAALRHAHADAALGHAFWLLTQIPLAARSAEFSDSLKRLGLRIGPNPTLLTVVAAFTDAVDHHVKRVGRRTDLGEMAQLAAAESLAAVAGRDLPSLFVPTADDAKLALGRLAAPNRFAALAREFFARLTTRYLDYFLSRELSNHVGPGRRLPSIGDHSRFNDALDQHCREVSRIIEAFAGGWFSKTHFDGGITPEKAQGFAYVALKKLQSELRRRSEADA